jgi:hypothetical protein
VERNKKIGSETEDFWKRNKAKIRWIKFALVGSEKFEAKRSEKKQQKNSRDRANACETDLISLCFALKRKHFLGETGTP